MLVGRLNIIHGGKGWWWRCLIQQLISKPLFIGWEEPLISCILLAFDLSAVVACISLRGWLGTAAAYRRSSRKVVDEVVFQVLVDVSGIQVPVDDGREVGIYLGRKVLQKGLKWVFLGGGWIVLIGGWVGSLIGCRQVVSIQVYLWLLFGGWIVLDWRFFRKGFLVEVLFCSLQQLPIPFALSDAFDAFNCAMREVGL